MLLVTGFKSLDSTFDSTTIDIKTLQKTPSIGVRSSVSDCVQSYNDNEFANRLNSKRSTSVRCIPFSLSELQTGTANFASGRLLGEGSIGCVYRAKYADGKVISVKLIYDWALVWTSHGHYSICKCTKIHKTSLAAPISHMSFQRKCKCIYDTPL